MRWASVSKRDRFTCDDAGNLLGEDAVIDGLDKVVGRSGRPGIHAQDDIDAEPLAVLALVREPACIRAP